MAFDNRNRNPSIPKVLSAACVQPDPGGGSMLFATVASFTEGFSGALHASGLLVLALHGSVLQVSVTAHSYFGLTDIIAEGTKEQRNAIGAGTRLSL